MKDASSLAMSFFGRVSATVKPEDNNQVLTEADIAVGKLLVERCKASFPGFNIIDEEAGVVDNGSSYTIVIDPIDGTSNFANSLPLFGIYMGVLKDDIPFAGAVALPAFGDLYIAEKGRGTYRNGKPVRVSDVDELKNALVAYGVDGHQEDPSITHDEAKLLGTIILSIRNLRSSNSAFDFAAVADGRYGIVLNRTSKIWDNVAAHIVIEEAGGFYTDYFGKPIDYARALERSDENFTVCAGSPTLHTQVQLLIHENNT
jgi:myo-inositol-1(or 4)-monophosphatase